MYICMCDLGGLFSYRSRLFLDVLCLAVLATIRLLAHSHVFSLFLWSFFGTMIFDSRIISCTCTHSSARRCSWLLSLFTSCVCVCKWMSVYACIALFLTWWLSVLGHTSYLCVLCMVGLIFRNQGPGHGHGIFISLQVHRGQCLTSNGMTQWPSTAAWLLVNCLPGPRATTPSRLIIGQNARAHARMIKSPHPMATLRPMRSMRSMRGGLILTIRGGWQLVWHGAWKKTGNLHSTCWVRINQLFEKIFYRTKALLK